MSKPDKKLFLLDAYALASHPDVPPAYGDDDAVAFFRAMAAGELPSVVSEGGGGSERASFVTGSSVLVDGGQYRGY